MSKIFGTFLMMNNVTPLIVILGGTGTGKSKLGIDIAKRLGSEIISADSMQVYKGLDILTNKVTPRERSEVPHHLLDFVSPLTNFTVVDFRDKSLRIIDHLLKSGKPPIVVGGTNYYIESILFHTLVANETGEKVCFDDNQEGLVSKVHNYSNTLPASKGIKRKIDKLCVSSMDVSSVTFVVAYKISVLISYCNKILNLFKNDLVNVNCKDLISVFDCLKFESSTNNFEEAIKLLNKNLIEYKNNSGELFILIKCCLNLMNTFNTVLNALNHKCSNSLEGNISEEMSFEKMVNNVKNHDFESILPIYHSLATKFLTIVLTDLPQYKSICRKPIDLYFNLNNFQSYELHEVLKRVDPARAECLHPNDLRKITRSLEVWLTNGRKHSEIISEQQVEGSALGGPLRFKNTIIFWLTADPDLLNQRLDNRVYQMLDQGLVKELLEFYAEYQPKEDDFTRGIFQSIGFKEFRDFLLLSEEDKNNEIGKKKLNDGIETLKLVTRRYVRYQTKWIKNRFLKYPDRDVPPIYNLNTSDVDRWDELVLEPAMDVITCVMEGKESKLKPLPKENKKTKDEIISLKSGQYYCEECKRTFVGSLQWNIHINSNKHKKVISKKKKATNVTCSQDTLDNVCVHKNS